MFSNLCYIRVSQIRKVSEPKELDIEDPDIIWMNKEKVKLAIKNKKFIGLTYATAALHWVLDE